MMSLTVLLHLSSGGGKVEKMRSEVKNTGGRLKWKWKGEKYKIAVPYLS